MLLAVVVQTPERLLSRTQGGQSLGNTWVQVSLLQVFSEPLMYYCARDSPCTRGCLLLGNPSLHWLPGSSESNWWQVKLWSVF